MRSQRIQHNDFFKISIGIKLLPELLTVTKDDIHVLVKRLELANEGARVLGGGGNITYRPRHFFNHKKIYSNLCNYLENDSHPVVDVVDHLVVLAHHHLVLLTDICKAMIL